MNLNPGSREKLRIVMNNYRMFGPWQTLRSIGSYLLTQTPNDNFDRKYNVSTTGLMEPADAGITNDVVGAYAVKYVPTQEQVMRHILLNTMPWMSSKKFSFIDLGCGRGRALLIAAQFPFEEIIGVELSSLHCETAVKNRDQYLARNKVACKNIRIECVNASIFDYPDANLMIYMYRPFLGPIFKSVLDRLCQFQTRSKKKVLLAYSCPVEERFLEEHPGFVKRKEYQVISIEYSWSLWECCHM